MGATRVTLLATSIAAIAIGLAAAPVARADIDRKTASPSECAPYAPDTTPAELVITPNGIYNPGTTIEKVICPLPRDQEYAYQASNLFVAVYYRVLGAAPGRATCTLFVGSTTMQSEAVVTVTSSGPLVSNGTRGNLQLTGVVQPPDTTVTSTVVCAISPKTSLGGISLYETGATNIEEPPV